MRVIGSFYCFSTNFPKENLWMWEDTTISRIPSLKLRKIWKFFEVHCFYTFQKRQEWNYLETVKGKKTRNEWITRDHLRDPLLKKYGASVTIVSFFFCPHSPGWNNLLRSRRDNNNDWLLNIFIILSLNFPEGVVRQDSKQLFLQRVKCHAWQAFDRERVFWARGRREGSYPSPFSLARGLAPKFPSTFERLPRRYRLHVYFARFFTVDQSPNYLLCDMIIVKQFRYFVQYISCGVSIQVKAFKQCFPVVLFIMLYFELIEGPVRNKKNFVCFAKKSVNRKPFLVRTIFPPTKIFSAVIKVQSCRREDLEAYNFLSGDKNPLFLDSYPSSGHSKRWWK